MRDPVVQPDGIAFDPDDLDGIHDYLQQMEVVVGTDELRMIVEDNWPEFLHKLKPPRERMH